MIRRPVCILFAAMGGEGGGVLADWLIDAATVAGLPVQSTSVPGVAQRTGATTYYVEIFPVPRAELVGCEPILSLTPTPGHVDLVAASELVEAGRALQNGFVDPRRTFLVSSTHREYAVSEKSAMGDGRFDSRRVMAAAQERARDCILFDMRALAQQHRTVINTVLFGAMASSGVLPFGREACEDAIRRSGKAVTASLEGFAAGYEHKLAPAADRPSRAVTPSLVISNLPESLRETVSLGFAHVADFQDTDYAIQYLNRVQDLLVAERRASGDSFPVTREAARFLALWMAYEDVIRVADLKTRQQRLARVRREAGAKDGEPLRVTEFLKPGLDELCSMLPTSLAEGLRRRYLNRPLPFHKGIHLRTDTVTGFLALVLLRSLKGLRRRTSRFATEQAAIGRWLGLVGDALSLDEKLALELALCGNLVKGYGETSERGHRNLDAILTDVKERASLDDRENWDELTERVRVARLAALADPEGRQLAGTLGLAKRPPITQPIRFVRRRPQS
jgi:indolepyruvate ferredoxin oxidoreductase beta subunit